MKKIIKLVILFTMFSAIIIQPIWAVESTPYSEAMVSLTFDDGLLSVYNYALPILSSRSMKATVFITTNFMETQDHLTWAQLDEMAHIYGWEVGSHTLSHRELPVIKAADVRKEIDDSLRVLTAKGFNVTSFATPYGAYDNGVLAEILKNYNLHRGFWDRDDLNSYPYDRSVIMVQSVENSTTLEQVTSWVDRAKDEGKWLVLVFHDVVAERSDAVYSTAAADLEAIADYILASGIKVVTMDHTLYSEGANLIANPSFSNGLASWTTDDGKRVTLNKSSMGSYPSPKESMQMQGFSKAVHLFSNKIEVDGTGYIFEAFVNADSLKSGEVGFYIDEYDADGNWISGKWLGKVSPKQVKIFSRFYEPTSPLVKYVSVQTYLTAKSNGKAYFDNYKLYSAAE